MLKTGKIRTLLFLCLTFVLILVTVSTSIVSGQTDPFKDIQGKLNGISEKERQNLKNLFVLAQEIEAMEKQGKDLAREIDEINVEIKSLELEIAKEEASFTNKREDLRQVLKTYQRMGPGTYLEIILDSDSITTFIRRVNILRDLTRNTGKLLDQLEESKDKLSAKKAELTGGLALIKVKQKQLGEALNKKVLLKEENERFLASLAEQRTYYQGFLADIQKMWGELKPVFKGVSKELTTVIEKGDLPQDTIKITFGYQGIKGSMEERTLNDIVRNNTNISGMVFDFTPGRVDVSVPDKSLILSGKFVIVEGKTIRFDAEEGSFYGMPLEAATIGELYQEGDMLLDFAPVLGDFSVSSMEIKDGYLEFSITADQVGGKK